MGVMSGKIDEIYLEDGKPKASVRIGSATVRVDLLLLMDAKVDDRVLFDSGMALSKIDEKDTPFKASSADSITSLSS
jgi:hydrogenase maturation factor